MKFFCFIVIALSCFCGYSQTKKIWVVDSLNNTPITNVEINTSKGNYYSNSRGIATIKESVNDIISFSHQGYIKKTIKHSFAQDTVFMVKKPLMLEDVTITSHKKLNLFNIGYYRSGSSGGLYQNNLKGIAAVYIPYYDYDNMTYINKIMLRIRLKDSSAAYNVYLYKPDSLGKPGQIIYKKHVIAGSLKKRGIINVSSLNISIPKNGIFIGFENLKEFNYPEVGLVKKKGIWYVCTRKIDSSKTFQFVKYNKAKKHAWFSSSVLESKGMHLTPCFGLQVYHK